MFRRSVCVRVRGGRGEEGGVGVGEAFVDVCPGMAWEIHWQSFLLSIEKA